MFNETQFGANETTVIILTPVLYNVRMAERSKALRSGRSPLLWAWVRIPLLTINFSSPRDIRCDETQLALIDRFMDIININCISTSFKHGYFSIVYLHHLNLGISVVRMAERSKAPDSREDLLCKTVAEWVFWSTNVGVGSNPTSDKTFTCSMN